MQLGRHGMPRIKGFTLLELMVALSIAAILLAVSTPAVRALYEGAQYRSVVGSTIELINAAKYKALTTGAFVDLKVSPKRGEITLLGRPSLDMASHITLHATVSEEYMHDAETGVIRFYPDASSTGGELQLLREDGSGVKVHIGWLLSDVHQSVIVAPN